ncbi:MAG: hypothetical protein LAT84_00490 [Balneolia bacterium]|nr:hypothetical protein [Balneolia bacterium]
MKIEVAMNLAKTAQPLRPSPSSSFKIRAFTPGDIESVVQMSIEHFPQCRLVSPGYLYETIDDLYFKDTFSFDGIDSLVAVDPNGTVSGFLGVTPKKFRYQGETILASMCNHLMASEEARSALVPMRLLQQFLSGPQKFSYADGSVESTRLLWKRLGGEPSFSNSVYYKVPLRPMSFGTRPLQQRFPNSLRKPIKKISYGADYLFGVARLPFSRRKQPDVRLSPIGIDQIFEGLNRIWRSKEIYPETSTSDLDKIFRLLKNDPRNGTLHHIGIWNNRDILTGWFIYYASAGGVCEVIQAVSLPGKETELFESICWHAYNEGGTELSGRAIPSQIGTPFTTKAFSMPGRMWTLFHCKDDGLARVLHSDKAFLTRMEGDLWLI